MKFLIKSNGKINGVKVQKSKIDGQTIIHGVEIDYTPPEIWSDLEFWLTDSEKGELLDYAKMIISKRQKMKFYKS